MEVRLNKFISDSGYCSRREADTHIQRKKVTINGKIAEIGAKVAPKDVVKVNGNLIENNGVDSVYIALNKPIGVSCTTDKVDKSNVIDYVKFPARIFNIGRLDKDSEGLLLLTNNGDVVNKILRAGNNHEKEYEVWVDKPVTDEFIVKMAKGVPILGTITKRCKVAKLGVNHFSITLTQGLNRQIRRMCEAFGYDVVALRRVRVMNIGLKGLPVGQWRILEGEELTMLLESLKDSDGHARASKGAGAGKKQFKPTMFKRTEEAKVAEKLENKPASTSGRANRAKAMADKRAVDAKDKNKTKVVSSGRRGAFGKSKTTTNALAKNANRVAAAGQDRKSSSLRNGKKRVVKSSTKL
ncbi:MAG: 23S rRNA pseudouridine(2604) synthase RluF [Bacteroidales bacterium]